MSKTKSFTAPTFKAKTDLLTIEVSWTQLRRSDYWLARLRWRLEVAFTTYRIWSSLDLFQP